MPQTILLTGTILASSIGCALITLLLLSAIKRSWEHLVGTSNGRWRFSDNHNHSAADSWQGIVRGYDTPELYQEDLLARTDRSKHGSLH